MKRLVGSIALAGALVPAWSSAQAPAFDASRSNAKSMALADEVMTAMGGRDAWQQTRYLRFDFAVEARGQGEPSARAQVGQPHRPLSPRGQDARGGPLTSCS